MFRPTRVTNCSQDSHLTLNHAVEIIGKVQQDLTIRVLASTDFGTGVGKFILVFVFATLVHVPFSRFLAGRISVLQFGCTEKFACDITSFQSKPSCRRNLKIPDL